MRYQGQEEMDAFCKRLIDEAGILLLLVSVYDAATNHFRVGFGRKNMPTILSKFQKFIEGQHHNLRNVSIMGGGFGLL